MLENLKSLFIVLSISIPIFWIVKPAFVNLLSEVEFKRYRNLWLLITLILFLANNFWLYIIVVIVAIQITLKQDKKPVALYFFLLFVLPPISQKIGAFGMLEYLFVISSSRMLELAILLPAFLALMVQRDKLPYGRTISDRLLLIYILLIVLFRMRDSSFTDALRQALYTGTDVFLPYYVISRSLSNLKQFKEVITTFVIAAILLSGIAVYEYASSQLLYSHLGNVLGANIDMSSVLMRGESLRALVTSGQPIALGFVLMVALGFFLYLQQDITQAYRRNLLLVMLAGGLFAALSRGPWVGMAVFLFVFTLLRSHARKNLAILVVGSLLSFALALTLPGGNKLIELLPFVGKTDNFNVEYRERLLDNSLIVIGRNPLFGSGDYRNTSEMASMVQGQGIIDIVNSYIGIALEYGLIGLSIFMVFFLNILWRIYAVLRQFRSRTAEHYLFGVMVFPNRARSLEDDTYLLGVALFAILVAILITIYTVSSITVIPVVYWAVAGMGAAYVQMMSHGTAEQK